MSTISKEWNGTLIEIRNTTFRTELVINGRTVDYVTGARVSIGENDYMHGYDGENHIEVRLKEESFLLIFPYNKAYFYDNGRIIYDAIIK